MSALLCLVLLVACGQPGSDEEANVSEMAVETPALSTSEGVAAAGSTPLSVANGQVYELGETGALDGRLAAVFPLDFDQTLSGLGNYQIEVNVDFGGQDAAGLPVAFTWRSVSTYASGGSGGLSLELSSAGVEQPEGVQSMILVLSGDRGFLYLPNVGCVSGSYDDFAEDMKLPLNPADLLDGLSVVEMVAEGVMINDQATTEYRFDQDALPGSAAGPWSIEGAAFLAEDSGLLTRTEMTISGQGDFMADGRVLNGVYEVGVDVHDLDEDLTIDEPEPCREAQLYPLTEDAFDVSAIDDLLAFKSLMPLEEVVEFYLAKMPSAGWQPLTEPDVIEDFAFLTFEKDGEQLTISIEYDPGSDGASVLVSP